MDKITIDVPKGQIAKVNKQSNGNVLITFESEEHWKFIKNVSDAIYYLKSNNMCSDLIEEYEDAPINSYTAHIAAYRIVIAALTDNEERHLTTGERWYPVVQFCKPGKEKNCYESEIIGSIELEGQKFTVVGGSADDGSDAGLGDFDSFNAVSLSLTSVSFRSVSRHEIAEHISKYFGRLLFEVHYGGVNCDWKWIID